MSRLSLMLCGLLAACCASNTEHGGDAPGVGELQEAVRSKSAAGVVPLTIAGGPRLAGAPLRTGVPFPMGALPSGSRFRLEDERGTPVAAQFDEIAHWPDGSIESVLVSFVSDVGRERTLSLRYGCNANSRANDSVRVTREGGRLVVDTGALRAVLDERGLVSALGRRAGPRDARSVLSKQDLFFENALDGKTYLASLADDGQAVVEEQGPIRATIRGNGTLRGPSGRLVSYQLRSSFYAQSDIVDVEASIIDSRPDDAVQSHPETFALAGKRWGLTFQTDSAPSRYRFGGEASVHAGALEGPVALQQRGSWLYDRSTANGTNLGYTFSYQGVGSGAKAPGWMALDSASEHVQVFVRDFWQQFPASLEVDKGKITLALFDGGSDTSAPAQTDNSYQRANSFYFEHPGGAKTYSVRLRLPARAEDDARIGEANDRYQPHRLDVMAPLDWYARSKVFGEYEPASTSGTVGYDATLFQNIYVPSMSVEGGHVPVAVTYGWRDFGDRLRHKMTTVGDLRLPAFYNDTHIGANQFLHEFIRTGDQRYFELGETATRHFRDIDVNHGPRSGYWDTGGLPQPPGEAKTSGHQNVDHEATALHWGHAHVSGLSDLYLLTGDKRSFEVLGELAGWWRFMRPYTFKLPFAFDDLYREAERDFGWPLYVMLEWVRVTGDAKYHAEVSAKLAEYMVGWWRTPHEHIGYDPATNTVSSNVVGINDASVGTGYWTMTLMDNSEDDNGDPVPGANGTNPWMAGPLLTNLVRFLDQDAAFAKVGKSASPPRAEMLDMLLQCMNYIVKYGWDPNNEWFVYSETTRGGYEGTHQLVYPLVRLDQEFKQALRNGSLLHPEWYDTQPIWLPIAKKKYDVVSSLPVREDNSVWDIKGVQSTGWYGYEMVYPIDFFSSIERAH